MEMTSPHLTPRPSQLIAEALVERQDPRQIVDRATDLGLSPKLVETIVAACCSATVVAPRPPTIDLAPLGWPVETDSPSPGR